MAFLSSETLIDFNFRGEVTSSTLILDEFFLCFYSNPFNFYLFKNYKSSFNLNIWEFILAGTLLWFWTLESRWFFYWLNCLSLRLWSILNSWDELLELFKDSEMSSSYCSSCRLISFKDFSSCISNYCCSYTNTGSSFSIN